MSYLRGPDRNQVQLLPPCIEDYVPANAPVRFIDAFVEGLDFQKLEFTHAQPANTGRPPYAPADLLKLYLYGYLNRIRSSRRLEAEAGRNLEVIWLLRGLSPDFKTIADFRKDNRSAFKGVFKQFNLLCRKLDLFGAELVAIDGTKFKALNQIGRYYTPQQLTELISTVEKRIEHYLSELDGQDAQAEGTSGRPSREELNQKIQQLKQQQGCYEQGLKDLQASDQKGIALSDPDSRKMKKKTQYLIGYNVQVAVDAKHDLIAVQEVTQAAVDRHQLSPMAMAAQQELQASKLQVVADKGYHQADQLQACEEAGLETFLPEQGTTSGRSKSASVYPKESFRYDASTDSYICPAGQQLRRQSRSQDGAIERWLYYNRKACQSCVHKVQCTTSKHRIIARRINEAAVEQAARRLALHPEKARQRKQIVEHVFGTLRMWGHDVFLLRGLAQVRAEFALSALAYNLRRALNVIEVSRLLKVTAGA